MDDLANRFAGLTVDRSTSPVPGTSGRFDMLPLELVQIIFAFFIPVGTIRVLDQRHGYPDLTSHSFRSLRRTLCAICLCNKFFYAVAHRLLYRTIVIEHQYRLALLFRTLSSTKKLRSLVKTFAWNPSDLHLLYTLEDFVHKTPEVKAKMRAIEEDIAFGLHWPMTPEEDYCLQQARANDGRLPWCSESLMTAVLGMLPGLKNLYVATAGDQQADPATGIIPSVGWVYDCLYSLLAYEMGGTKFGFLQNLKVFALDDRSDASYSPHGTMLLETHFVLQACPNLRRIEYRTRMDEMTQDFNFDDGNDEFGLGPHGAFSSSVEEVIIAFGCTPMATLPRLLRDLSKLKVLRAEFRVASADWDVTDGSADVPTADETAVPGSWQNTRSALLEAKLTLKELHLTSRRDLSWRGWDRRFPSGPWPVIDTPKLGRVLPQMSALTSLTIEPISLFNISHGTTAKDAVMPRLLNLLPPSLQSLRLVDYWGVAWRTIPGHDFSRKLSDYFRPRFHWGFGTASVFWKNVMTDVLDDIATRPPLALKEIIICTPASRSVGSGLRNEQPDGGGAWLVEDPSRSLFSQFERVGITLVVENFRFMTSIPKEEWTFLEGY
ncbi:hypothetical protein F5X68DRAFT_228269 [Plectosphaerella plurivora]|uniref:F-box domain-containing protein n=1 Tax=Plectosphaerella plurivora TaxID=936078 RepID=A0A9P9AE38_9PEZI|nr:hypothetical protein F5X68DRAFT_228269 [Plectosphaerella plurivora]